jgi:hypothetical protein
LIMVASMGSAMTAGQRKIADWFKESNIGVAREQYFAFNEVTSWLNLVAHEHGEDGQFIMKRGKCLQ